MFIKHTQTLHVCHICLHGVSGIYIYIYIYIYLYPWWSPSMNLKMRSSSINLTISMGSISILARGGQVIDSFNTFFSCRGRPPPPYSGGNILFETPVTSLTVSGLVTKIIGSWPPPTRCACHVYGPRQAQLLQPEPDRL